jgi:hypothetical protein
VGRWIFWINLRQKIENPKYLKVFVSKKTKGPKQDNQNRLMAPMSKGGALVLSIITLFRDCKF